jgi:transposase
VWNRDINAARNILAKAKYQIENLKELKYFSRKKAFPEG